MAITPKNNDPKEPKLCDFSYISMTNPPIPFWGLKMAKKGFLKHFCCWRYQYPDQKLGQMGSLIGFHRDWWKTTPRPTVVDSSEALQENG